MIEGILLDWLTEALSVPVRMEIPSPMPEKFVVLEKTGSSRQNHIFSATIAVQSFAPSLYEAAVLNEDVKGVLLYGSQPDGVCRVELNSDYNYTNPDLDRYRYQAVYDITHYYTMEET